MTLPGGPRTVSREWFSIMITITCGAAPGTGVVIGVAVGSDVAIGVGVAVGRGVADADAVTVGAAVGVGVVVTMLVGVNVPVQVPVMRVPFTVTTHGALVIATIDCAVVIPLCACCENPSPIMVATAAASTLDRLPRRRLRVRAVSGEIARTDDKPTRPSNRFVR